MVDQMVKDLLPAVQAVGKGRLSWKTKSMSIEALDYSSRRAGPSSRWNSFAEIEYRVFNQDDTDRILSNRSSDHKLTI